MLDKIESLAEQLKLHFPEAKIRLETFPSGSAMLDIRRHGRIFIMDYTPEYGFGVDELKDNEGFNTGYQFFSKDFNNATDQLYSLLQDTVS